MTPHEWLMVEVDELARNETSRCTVCRQSTQFWPTRPATRVRAAGRGWTDRCETCVLSPDLVSAALFNRRPSMDYRLSVRERQSQDVLTQIAEVEALPPGAEKEQALELLYLQLQLLTEEIWSGGVGLKVLPGGRDRGALVPGEAGH